MGAGMIEPGAVITPERKAGAEQRAERIVANLATAAEDYAQAILDQDWTAMGLSPEQWRARLFGDTRLTAEGRRQVAELLSGKGMSQRQVAAATGTPRTTVERDLDQNGPPALTSQDVTKRNAGPKSGAQRVREHRDRQRQDGTAGRVPAAVTVTLKPPAVVTEPGSAPRQCPGCRAKDELISDLQAQLEAAHRRPASPATAELLTAERDAIAADRDRLAARVRELETELSAGQIAPQPVTPPGTPARPPEPPGSAPVSGQPVPEPRAPKVQCGSSGAALVKAPGEGARQAWLCPAHRAEAGQRTGVTLEPVPYDHDFEDGSHPCQYLVPVPVTTAAGAGELYEVPA